MQPAGVSKSLTRSALAIPLFLAFLTGITVAAETWRGIVVAPEHRCSPYKADNYSYSSSLEARIVSGLSGKVYGPYSRRCFSSSQDRRTLLRASVPTTLPIAQRSGFATLRAQNA